MPRVVKNDDYSSISKKKFEHQIIFLLMEIESREDVK